MIFITTKYIMYLITIVARNTILNAIYQLVIVLLIVNNAGLLKSILNNNLWLACNAIKNRYHPSGTQRFHTLIHKSTGSFLSALYSESICISPAHQD